MIFDSLTNTQKWAVALVVSVCFIIVVSPIMFNILNKFGDSIGIRLSNSQGCTSLIGMIVQMIIFFILVRLTIHILSSMTKNTEKYSDSFSEKNTDNLTDMEKVLDKFYPPYNGLVSPGDMLRCSGAELLAESNNSPVCVDASRQCMSSPFSKECKEKLINCKNTSSQALSTVVIDNCGFGFRN